MCEQVNLQKKIAHLGFIQGVINRMGTNSFLLKGWTVTLVAALMALSSKGANGQFITVVYFPVFVFWALDAFFLHQEKLYRKLYEKVALDELSQELTQQFSLNTNVVKDKVGCIVVVAFSKTLWPFYTVVLVSIFAAAKAILE